jgi:flagellar biosynthetic protein FlhB
VTAIAWEGAGSGPWFANASERRLPPTARHRQEARRRGQVWRSPDFNGALAVMLAVLFLRVYLPWAYAQMGGVMPLVYDAFAAPHRLANLPAVAMAAAQMAGLAAAPLVALLMLAGLAVGFASTGFLFTTEPLTPQLDRINPASGLTRLFSVNTLWELGKGFLKLLAVGALAGLTIASQLPQYAGLIAMPLGTALATAGGMLFAVLWHAAAGYLLVGIIDVGFQMSRHQQSLMMTHREMRDEVRQAEGDPQIRQRRRQAYRRLLRSGLGQVRTATVVVTNPTHLAVALKWDERVMAAPQVVAKGEDQVALEIRGLAIRHGVPIVQNPALARDLFPTPLGEAVPAALYRAVAEVIAYVMRTGRP